MNIGYRSLTSALPKNPIVRVCLLFHLLFTTIIGVQASPIPIILDTDMTYDVDDVGALATLHALADLGEIEILGVAYNEIHRSGVAAIQVINAWYGREHIPVAGYTGPLHKPDKSKYLDQVATMGGSIPKPTTDSATILYRRLLKESEDHSVVIVSVGFLNNLDSLLAEDRDLVARKVKQLVVMAGIRNDQFNFVRHNLVAASQRVLENWPTPLVVVDYGGDVMTGEVLSSAPSANPVRKAYESWFDGSIAGRSSWDQVAVLYAARGETGHFKQSPLEEGLLSNGYTWTLDGTHRSYVEPTQKRDYYVREIERLMGKTPEYRLNN